MRGSRKLAGRMPGAGALNSASNNPLGGQVHVASSGQMPHVFCSIICIARQLCRCFPGVFVRSIAFHPVMVPHLCVKARDVNKPARERICTTALPLNSQRDGIKSFSEADVLSCISRSIVVGVRGWPASSWLLSEGPNRGSIEQHGSSHRLADDGRRRRHSR